MFSFVQGILFVFFAGSIGITYFMFKDWLIAYREQRERDERLRGFDIVPTNRPGLESIRK